LKVLLNQDIEKLGRMGEIVEVKAGYARNFLIPKGFAMAVTRGRLKEIEERKKVLKVKAERQRVASESLAEKIKSCLPLKIKASCSASGKLFGSITNRHVAQAIYELTGEEVDRHKIAMDERIRSVGSYSARLKLHPDVEIEITFEVEGEGFVAEEPGVEHSEAEVAVAETFREPEGAPFNIAEEKSKIESPAPIGPETGGEGERA